MNQNVLLKRIKFVLFKLTVFWVLNLGSVRSDGRCTNVASLTNGRLVTSRESYAIGDESEFHCSRGFIVGSSDKGTAKCFPSPSSDELGIWKLKDYQEDAGCEEGCAFSDQCPWGTFCNGLTKVCEYKVCPNQIQNGTLVHEASSAIRGMVNALGHTAYAGCHMGFVVEHPDDLVVLVRDGFEIPADRVVVQCHLDENDPDATPQWYILYRRSSQKLLSVDLTQDVVHRSRVPMRCIRGCRYDTHCPISEMCHKELCIPKVCTTRSLGPNIVFMMNKAANTGLKSMIRCSIGYLFAGLNHNFPLSVSCRTSSNPAEDPEWVLTEDGSDRVLCTKKCRSDDQCQGAPLTERCISGVCVYDCMQIAHGVITDEYSDRMTLNSSYEHFSIGNVAKLTCDMGYVVNDPKFDKQVTIICLYHEKDGSHWRFKDGTAFRKAKCRRGCSSNKECHEDESCNVLTQQCFQSQCDVDSLKGLKGSVVVTTDNKVNFAVGEEVAFKCHKGHIFLDTSKTSSKPKTEFEIICSAVLNPGKSGKKNEWKIKDSGKSLGAGCVEGCLSDLDCSDCQYCDLRRYICRPRMCDCNHFDLNAIYPKISVAATCNQQMTISCKHGYIFDDLPGPNGTIIDAAKTATLICSNVGKGEWAIVWGQPEVPKCVPGCMTNSDCTDPSKKHCSPNGHCEKTRCSQTPNDPHSKFEPVDDSWSRVLKKCNPSYIINATNEQSEAQLVCHYENGMSKPEYRVEETGLPEPLCIHYCSTNDDCIEGKEACLINKCVEVICPLTSIPYGTVILSNQGDGGSGLPGVRGYLYCSSGFVLYRNEKGTKGLQVICAADSNGQFKWSGIEGSTVECVKGCKTSSDCDDLEECDEDTSQCTPLQCRESLIKIGGKIGLEGEEVKHRTLGSTGFLRCEEGMIYKNKDGQSASKKVNVKCIYSRPRPKWVDMEGNSIGPCRKGCITDCDCSPGEKCQKWNCVTDVCSLTTKDCNVHFARIPNQQNPGRSLNSTSIIQCPKGEIMTIENKHVSALEVVCTHFGSCEEGQTSKFVDVQHGVEPSPCKPGCLSDDDCPHGDEICDTAKSECVQEQKCDPDLFSMETHDENSRISQKPDSDMLAKVCNEGYRLNNGEKFIEIICGPNGDWSLRDGKSIPKCCRCPDYGKCQHHCPNECDPMVKISRGQVLLIEGHLSGARASIMCHPGAKIRSSDDCLQTTHLICHRDTIYGTWWRSHTGGPIPKCKKLHFNTCCVDADCQSSVKQCIRGKCEPLQCASSLDDANGKLITSGSRELGKNAALVCDEGYYYPKSPFDIKVEIFCDKQLSELEWVEQDGSNVVACVKGCMRDDHCSDFQFCNLLTKTCKNFNCPLNIIDGAIFPGITEPGSESLLVCDDGYLLDFNNEKEARIICSASGDWKTINGDRLVHKHICQQKCNLKYSCDKEYFCDKMSGDMGRCIKNSICPQSPPGSNGLLNPDKHGSIEDRAQFLCPVGYAMYLPNHHGKFEVQLKHKKTIFLTCTEKGWKFENGGKKLPICKKVSSKCLMGDASECSEDCDQNLPQYVGSILKDGPDTTYYIGDKKIFTCDPGYILNPLMKVGPMDLNKLPTFARRGQDNHGVNLNSLAFVICTDDGWKIPRGKLGYNLLPCVKDLTCDSDQDCDPGKRCQKRICTFKTVRLIEREKGTLITDSDSPIIGSIAIFECKPGFVYDSPIGHVTEVEVVAIDLGNEVKWVQKFGDPLTDCREGCRINQDCKPGQTCSRARHVCIADTCKSLNPVVVVYGIITYLNGMAYLKCLDNYMINDAGLSMGASPSTDTALFQCFKNYGNHFWRTSQGGKLIAPKCVLKECGNCPNGEFCEGGKCVPDCNPNQVPVGTYLVEDLYWKSNGLGKGDTAGVNGKIRMLACKNPGHKMIAMQNKNVDSRRCFGNVVHIVCLSGMWKRLDNANELLPECRSVCGDGKSCGHVVETCDKSCDVCVADEFESCPCSGSTVCNFYEVTQDDRCLPSCPTKIENTIIQHITNLTAIARCKFHYEFAKDSSASSSAESLSSIEVICSRSGSKAMWVSKRTKKPLPACQFSPRFCREESLLSLHNARCLFKPGNNPNPNQVLETHSSVVSCNEDGFFLAKNDVPLSNGGNEAVCSNRHTLTCKEGDYGLGIWFDENGQMINTADLTCKKGCVKDSDCDPPNSYCDSSNCQCQPVVCPLKWTTGELDACVCRGLFKLNELLCDRGHLVQQPGPVLSWYFSCRNKSEVCSVNEIPSTIPIKCVPLNRTNGIWIIDYDKLFEIAVPKPIFPQSVPAFCKEGCFADADCPRGSLCLREKKGNSCDYDPDSCGPGHCVPETCPDPGDCLAGSVEKNGVDAVLESVTIFRCNPGYFMLPNKETSVSVVCKIGDDGIMKWVVQPGEASIPQCYKQCKNDQDCDYKDECQEGACKRRHCNKQILYGTLHSEAYIEGALSTLECHHGYVIKLEKEGEELKIFSKKSDLVCHYDKKSGIMRWVLKSNLHIPAECIEGCVTNKDCRDFSTKCQLSTGQCIMHECPKLAHQNGLLEKSDDAPVVGDVKEFQCRPGFLYKRTYNKTIVAQCRLEQGTPEWREKETGEALEDCVPGCTCCDDCGDQEICQDYVCRPVQCSTNFGEHSGIRMTCAVAPEVGTACTILATDGKVIKDPVEGKWVKSMTILCSLVPNQKSCPPTATWNIPEIKSGCTSRTETTDCTDLQFCNSSNKCEAKSCSLIVPNGEIIKNKGSGYGMDVSTDQRAILQCKDSVVKTKDGQMIGDGKQQSLMVVCALKEDRRLYWTDLLSGKPVLCDKECYTEKECRTPCYTSCKNHRCVSSCCNLPKQYGHIELCTKSDNPIQVGQSNRICCKNGYIVMVYGVPSKSTRANCQQSHEGATLVLEDETPVTEKMCIPGCTKSTVAQDCGPMEDCINGVCQPLPCSYPIVKNGVLTLIGECSKSKSNHPFYAGHVGCEGLWQCKPEFIYPLDNGDRTKAVTVRCTIDVSHQSATWKIINDKTEALQELKNCVKGCVIQMDCMSGTQTPCRKCTSDFQCVEMECKNIHESLSVKYGLESKKIGSSGVVSCPKGKVFTLPSGEVTKHVGIKCCDMDQQDQTCSLEWGLHPTCGPFGLVCKDGCLPISENDANSLDCEESQECKQYTCVPKTCIAPVLQNGILKVQSSVSPDKTDYQTNSLMLMDAYTKNKDNSQTFPIGSLATLECNRGYSAYVNTTKMTKTVKLICRLSSTTYKAQFTTESGREIPDCELGCLTNNDCVDPDTQCYQGTCIRKCDKFDVEYGQVDFAQDTALGSEAVVTCNPGYLLSDRELKQISVVCKHTDRGPRFCTQDNLCGGFKCCPGCLSDKDCNVEGEVCSSAAKNCPHSQCCTKITCPGEIIGKNGSLSFNGGQTTSRPVPLNTVANFICKKRMVYPCHGDREPSSSVEVKCATESKEDTDGVWLLRESNLPLKSCIIGCNRNDRGAYGCFLCDWSTWRLKWKTCPSVIANGALFNLKKDNLTPGSEGIALCDEQYFIRPSMKYPPMKKVNLQCACDETEPKWLAEMPGAKHTYFVEGCTKGYCLEDKDCSGGEICNIESYTCEKSKCLLKVEDPNSILLRTKQGFSIQCKPKHYLAYSRNEEQLGSSFVRCCYSSDSKRHLWVETWRPENFCQREAKCERYCKTDNDCPLGGHCAAVKEDQKIVYKCVESRCAQPFDGIYGTHVDFPIGVGLEVGKSAFFRCNDNYAIPPVDESKTYRKEVRIFCQKVYNPESGVNIEYRLQTGVKIPPCEINGCETSSDCCTNTYCKDGHCVHKVCPSSTFKANSFIQGNGDHKVGSSDYVRCENGYVMRQNGQCFRVLQVSCKANGELQSPFWTLATETDKYPQHCVRGCTSDDDCGGLNPTCDPLTCTCVTKICKDTKTQNGFIQLDSTALPGSTATFVCKNGHSIQDRSSELNKKSTTVVCIDINPEPEWRLPNGDILPDCKLDQYKNDKVCKTDVDCDPFHQCIMGRCLPEECERPLDTNLEQVIIPKDTITIGTIIDIQCKDSNIFGPGSKLVKLICRVNQDGQKELATLDGSKKGVCYEGCIDNKDCKDHEVCMDEWCEPLACQPPIIPNGKLVPLSSSMLNAVAKIVCENGYLLDSGLKVGDATCVEVKGQSENDRIAEWRMDGVKVIPPCLPGCKTRLDCSLGKTCKENICQWDQCPKVLPQYYYAILTDIEEHPYHMTNGKLVCQEGWILESLGGGSVAITCYSYGETPKWILTDGSNLPKCVKQCTEDDDCEGNDVTCDEERHRCVPQSCPTRIDRINGHAEFPSSPGNKTLDSLSLNSVGILTCDRGFILEPSQLKKEISNEIPIHCKKDLICGGTDWKLDDGSDVPECIPGCRTTEDCLFDQICDFDHVCVDLTCPLPELNGVLFQLSEEPPKLGTSGTVLCSKGYIYKSTRRRSPKKHINIFCKPDEGNVRKGIFIDQYGQPLSNCVRGCLLKSDCDESDTCIDNECKPKYTCLMDSLKNLNGHVVLGKENFRSQSHVGARATLVCSNDKNSTSYSQELTCTPKGWKRIDGQPLMACHECVADSDCSPPRAKCDTKSGHCEFCVNDRDCPSGGVCQDANCNTACKSDLDCTKIKRRDMQKCDETSGRCYQCLTDVDCSRDDVNRVCSIEHVCEAACKKDQDCPGKLWCNLEKGRCEWPCRKNDDCPGELKCNLKSGTCSIGNSSTWTCHLPNPQLHHGAIHNADNYTLIGTFAQFICHQGFRVPEESQEKIGVLCTENGWRRVPTHEKLPICVKKQKRCLKSHECPPVEGCILGQCYKKINCNTSIATDPQTTFNFRGGTEGSPGDVASLVCAQGFTISKDLVDQFKQLNFAMGDANVKPYRSKPGWFEYKTPPDSKQTTYETQINTTLVIPVPVSGQSLKLYCLGGQWLQKDGSPIPKCVPTKVTACNLASGRILEHGASYLKSKCILCICNNGIETCNNVVGCA